MNNKGYAFVIVVLFFLILTSLTVFLTRQGVYKVTNQAIMINDLMDKFEHEYEKDKISLITSFKEVIYGNISNHSLVNNFLIEQGVPLVNDPVFELIIPAKEYSHELVNISFQEEIIGVQVNYSLNDLNNAGIVTEQTIQNCLNNEGCTESEYVNVLNYCLSQGINGFKVRNLKSFEGYGVPAELELYDEGMTLIKPYYVGVFLFNC